MSKKILTIVYSLGKGGVERTAQIFAESYAMLGMDSRVLATREGGVREQCLRDRGIHYWISSTSENIQGIEKWNPDIIHIHSHYFTPEDYKAFSSLFSGRSVVEQNIFSQPNPWTAQMKVSFQMTHWCDWRFRKNKGALGVRTAIIPNATNIQAFSKCLPEQVVQFRNEYGIPKKSIVIGRIGQNHEGKWSPILIKMFDKLCKENNNLHLLLVNPPASIELLARKSIFRDRITIIERIIGDKNLSIAYSSIDIFALAAVRGESFGNVLAESMLCETPVVALSSPWRDNSQCEVVGHRRGGFITLTPTAFKDAIQELINNKELREYFGKCGRARVVEKFNYLEVGKAAIEVIEGNFTSLTDEELREKIISIYKDAYDEPSYFSILMLRIGLPWLTRYTSGYEPIYKLPLNTLPELARNIKRRVFAFFERKRTSQEAELT